MSNAIGVREWPERIRKRYANYLKTSFFVRDPDLRASFENALRKEDSLLKGPFEEQPKGFAEGIDPRALAEEYFPSRSGDLVPALLPFPLYMHQEQAIRGAFQDCRNIVAATGTASGKTESFLYPILFELFRQHLEGCLAAPGVRALILYPMNALANDQRERLGMIRKALDEADSAFRPTFGQYIGQTPWNVRDTRRNGEQRAADRFPGELAFRDDMLDTPPHILLTNYSMLEYLLIRPKDSLLFDGGRGSWWQFIVLDEAHQYRGAKGMEMGMLIRRLKQRLRDGGRGGAEFRCIATSATISSGEGQKDRDAVAGFAGQLFGEEFPPAGVVFGTTTTPSIDSTPRRYHAFLRALEGAFLLHSNGGDRIVLNRRSDGEGGERATPLEIALCRECGQHYYVGQELKGMLSEAVRDPSHTDFGVEYYLPSDKGNTWLCRQCGALSGTRLVCHAEAAIRVDLCESHNDHPDQLKKCGACGYRRGGIGDPVQEIVHGSDGPNTVIATALHELLPVDRRRVLAFADSRQEAAFFAWYAENSYSKLRDRNLMLKAVREGDVQEEGLSISDLSSRLKRRWEEAGLFEGTRTREARDRSVLTAILREAMTDEKRLSLSGVGLIRWHVALPRDLHVPDSLLGPPWNLSRHEALALVAHLLDEMRARRAMGLPNLPSAPTWDDVSPWGPHAYSATAPRARKGVSEWGGAHSAAVSHYLFRILDGTDLPGDCGRTESVRVMKEIWSALLDRKGRPPVLIRGQKNGTFQLNSDWVRVSPIQPDAIWECRTCATIASTSIRGVCPRSRCPGFLAPADPALHSENHYRILYESLDLPATLRAEEHTAQIDSEQARQRQDDFKAGAIHLLSSSTTFEVGVDLGDLDVVFLRNVPPEPFNYAQRVGRAGRRDTPGLALTYCRRNSHDLYHYEEPESRLVTGAVQPPRLVMTNEKIILRHMVAAALSTFFREHVDRFDTVEAFTGDWHSPSAALDLRRFCEASDTLSDSLRRIVPESMAKATGLQDCSWIMRIAGPESRLALVEMEVCEDYRNMLELRDQYFREGRDSLLPRISRRIRTIATEKALNFLSRKAVIPKYGFPVDVVELDTHTGAHGPAGVTLQRDLSQAIAEYAPGGKVVANKLEWESCGIKRVSGKAWPVRHYRCDETRSFAQWEEGDPSAPRHARKYLVPEFGFVTPLVKPPSEPRGRARRLYATRPFFRGFDANARPDPRIIHGVSVTRACPGTLVVLCEGKERAGFYICRTCGTHMAERAARHNSPWNSACEGMLERFSLGHELTTDVVRLQFPGLREESSAYSTAYAIVLGAAESLNVPDTDLNVTLASGGHSGETAIVLYDDVPGGAGLVAQLEEERLFANVLVLALERMGGGCGCDSSCYGCLRSYRNQFAHSILSRVEARSILLPHAVPT